MKVYLASSGRNRHFAGVRDRLREAGHEVYDWTQGVAAYRWEDVGVRDTDHATVPQMRRAAKHPALLAGMSADLREIEDEAQVFVLLLPAGADAHYKLGRASLACWGPRYILALEPFRASQFYAEADGILGSVEELLEVLK